MTSIAQFWTSEGWKMNVSLAYVFNKNLNFECEIANEPMETETWDYQGSLWYAFFG